jgi:hypothetical protein
MDRTSRLCSLTFLFCDRALVSEAPSLSCVAGTETFAALAGKCDESKVSMSQIGHMIFPIGEPPAT